MAGPASGWVVSWEGTQGGTVGGSQATDSGEHFVGTDMCGADRATSRVGFGKMEGPGRLVSHGEEVELDM